ncbi:diguanylate cyclase (GGDEF) domain-containing protein [Thiorhodovibrio frisius]|uniref:diguanylate cyclase n=2 Tax=Thiorhodovibrio frisius TaxID=631362 RepID=H8Z082_9GAMM|nr:diguanylate cyclase (GGDEF) domain-containing protein [Thiorhodovibrio frisius]WPL24584.1 putative diguanylate cyclase YdaM [Thiorhodovibrio frisius]
MADMGKHGTTWRSFFLLYPLLALVPVAIVTGYSLWSFTDRLEAVKRSERIAVDLEREAVTAQLQPVAKDVCVLAQQNELATLLLGATTEARLAMASEYLALARNSHNYDQIRYLDESGQEIVRVNQGASESLIVSGPDLQNKSGRPYFTESLPLQSGQVYLSPLDLNIEHGQIETPYKPMIRLATPVEDSAGRKRGVIVINLLAQGILDQVQAAGDLSPGQVMMLNDQGYWLITPNPPPGWGFMFPERAKIRMPELYPEVWAHMNQNHSGMIHSAQGIFTYDHYNPLDHIDGCSERPDGLDGAISTTGYPWVLVSHLPQSVINGWRHALIVRAVLIGVPVLVLLAIGTRSTLLVVAERRRHREHLEALARFDALTGLANRATFEEALREELQRSERHQRRLAVLYLDLDGFKEINDTQGHKRGDEVLIEVAQVLKTCCRATDLAARHGGDEFALMLAEVADANAATAVAEKIRLAIGQLSWDGLGVGASIGIALWPDHCPDQSPDQSPGPSLLLHLADEAMYHAKSDGKNRIRLANA